MNKVYEKPAVIVDEVAAEGSGVQFCNRIYLFCRISKNPKIDIEKRSLLRHVTTPFFVF